MAHRVILQHELTGKGSIAVERNGCGAIQLFIAKSADGRSRRGTIACQQGEGGFLGNAVILLRVVAIP